MGIVSEWEATVLGDVRVSQEEQSEEALGHGRLYGMEGFASHYSFLIY